MVTRINSWLILGKGKEIFRIAEKLDRTGKQKVFIKKEAENDNAIWGIEFLSDNHTYMINSENLNVIENMTPEVMRNIYLNENLLSYSKFWSKLYDKKGHEVVSKWFWEVRKGKAPIDRYF